jgi:hypothetical protein
MLYRKKRNLFSTPLLYAAVVFARILVASLLSFLLLSPILKYFQNQEEKPVIAFIQDNSASEKFAFKKIDSVAYRKNVEKLLEGLEKNYTVKRYQLGSRLQDSLQYTYSESSSDLSTGLETLFTSMENENLGAVILSSDGIYNKGSSPLSLSYPFKGTVYTIGLGDTTTQRDALIARVYANKVVYLGDPFVIRTDLAAFGCNGENVTVTLYNHTTKRMVSSQQVRITDGHFSKSLENIIDATAAGIQHYTLTVSKVDGEQNVLNNSQDVYVEVLDSKEAVLIVAQAPHPDIYALREALSKNKNYKVDVRTVQKMDATVSNYNLIILHNLPSAGYNASALVEQAKRMGISLWYIVGSQTSLPAFNQSQTAMQIIPRGAGLADAQALPNATFSYFGNNLTPAITSLPPLALPFAEYKAGVNTQVYMNQRVGSVNTSYPLWLMQQTPNQRVGVLAGEGLWRWRLYNYEQYKNFTQVDDCLLKTAQFLSVKRDKKQFRIDMPKSVYTESESIPFDAELYNENYELINTPDVTLQIIDSAGGKKTYSMNKESNSYALLIGNLPASHYSYVAQTNFNGKAYSATGNFHVVAQNIEEMNTTADFGMLNQFAKNYQGEMVFATNLNTLQEKIEKNPNIKTFIRTTVNTEPLIHWKWLFALLAGLLALEWFIRKRSGNY